MLAGGWPLPYMQQEA